jgi:hypothetical protein
MHKCASRLGREADGRTKRPLIFRRLYLTGHGLDVYAGTIVKVFCFFSSEKKTLHS